MKLEERRGKKKSRTWSFRGDSNTNCSDQRIDHQYGGRDLSEGEKGASGESLLSSSPTGPSSEKPPLRSGHNLEKLFSLLISQTILAQKNVLGTSVFGIGVTNETTTRVRGGRKDRKVGNYFGLCSILIRPTISGPAQLCRISLEIIFLKFECYSLHFLKSITYNTMIYNYIILYVKLAHSCFQFVL